MKKNYKKFVALIVGFTITLTSFTASFGQPIIIHERKTSEIISSGVIHEHIQKFTEKGWWNINILRVNLDDKYTEVKPIFSNDGLNKRDKVSNMVENQNAIAGINGDFFASFNYSSPLGMVVVDGKVISTVTEREENLPTLSIGKDNQALLSYWTTTIKAITESGNMIDIRSKNKASSTYDAIRVYDSSWNKKSFGNTLFKDMVEVIIDNNEVIDVRSGQTAVDIPKDGYILVGRENAGKILLDNFKVGDKVYLEIASYPDYENIKAALGGGALIVKEGTPFKNPKDIYMTGEQPRTAIGITKDKKQLLMVTLDGRHTSYKGVSQETLAQIMIELGAYEAINLDGGGSTTMAINPIGDYKTNVVNNPSDGGERLVSNGLGIFNNAPNMPLDYIKIYTDDTKVFTGTSREFYIKGFDEYHNPVEVDIEDARFNIEESQGNFIDNILNAEGIGEATVRATYGGKTATMKINILEPVKDIEIEIDKIHMDFNSQKSLGQIYGVNNEGFTAKINPKDIKWQVVGGIGEVREGIIYSSDKISSGYITASVGDAIENILVSIGYSKKPIHNFEDTKSLSFISYPKEVTGSINLNDESKLGNYSLKLDYDFTKLEQDRAAYLMLGDQGITLTDKPNKVGMWVYGNKSNHWLRGKIVDGKGTSYNIDFANSVNWEGWKWVTADIPTNVSYPVKLERIYLVEVNPANKTKGNILIDDLNALYSTPINTNLQLPTETTINDPLNRESKVNEGGYKFEVVNGVSQADTLLKFHIGKKTSEVINSTDFGIIMGNINSRFNTELTKPNIKVNTGYGAVSHKNTLFINLDNSKNSLRETDYNQWIWLKEKLNKSMEKNVVVTLPKEVFGSNGFTDKLEAQLFDEVLLEQRKNGKNVFVITGGQETEVEVRAGIRYIKLKNNSVNSTSDIFDLQHISFTVNGNEISYEILSLFP